MGNVAFWILSLAAVASAVVTVTRKNPLASALALVVSLASVAGLFATLSAHFLFVIQLLVYAGAVMVLVIYVIMILDLREREMRLLGLSRGRASLAVAAALPIVFLLVRVASGGGGAAARPAGSEAKLFEAMAERLFTEYLVPFELLSVLLLAAMVGAVVLAMRRF